MPPPDDLAQRLERLGAQLGAREAEHRDSLERASAFASALHARIVDAVGRFHDAASKSGAPHLLVHVSELRPDEKHLRSVEFDLTRGRHRALVTSKSRGEVTLVGPFRVGKTEGPCRSFPFEAEREIDEALVEFLERFLEEAATP